MDQTNIQTILPLTGSQEALLFHELQSGEAANVQVRFSVDGIVDDANMAAAWQDVVARHDSLRALIYIPQNGNAMQVVARTAHLEIEAIDLTGLCDGEQVRRIAKHVAADAGRPLPLRTSPVGRLTVFMRGEKRRDYLWTVSKLFVDGWSAIVVLRDVMTLFGAKCDETRADLLLVPSLQRYVAALKAVPVEASREFWGELFSGYRNAAPVFRTALGASATVTGRLPVPAGFWEEVKTTAVALGVTPAAWLSSAWAIFYAFCTGGNDLAFALSVSGRSLDIEGIEAMVGPLATAVPRRARIDQGMTVADLARQFHLIGLRAQPHEVLPPTDIFGGSDATRNVPVPETLLTIEALPDHEIEIPSNGGVRLSGFRSDVSSAFPINLVVIPGETAEIHFFLQRLVDPESAQRALEHFPALLKEMASEPDRPIDTLRKKFGATMALSDEREKEQATLRASHGGADPGLLAGASGFEAAEVFGNRGTRRRLPPAARGGRKFVAPRTQLEETLAAVWSEVLRIDDLSVHDNFFELGGHSLFAISVIDKMRQIGLKVGVRSLFEAPTIAELSASVGAETSFVAVPPNLIPEACSRITPDMLTLIDLDQSQIDAIVTKVPDGASNVQDIYPLAPLQDGFLFHHRQTSEGDLYTMLTQFGFDSRERLDAYVKALQVVVNRHDTMRSMFLWEGLEEPVQVVCRSASIGIEEVRFDPAHGDIAAQLREKFNASNFRFDLAVPPLIRIYIAQDTEKGRWVLHQLTHHFMGDRVSIGIQEAEVKAILQDQGETLPRAAQFRNYVAQARLGMPQAEHAAYFGDMLADVDEPTVPFGIVDVLGAGARVDEVNRLLDADLSRRVVEVARRIGVSTAALFHEAFAQLLARISNRDDVVFGTVLLGRMIGGDGAERIIGPCINTVPIRIHTGGRSLRDGVRRTQSLLAKSLRHEHAPLSLSQRCSGVRSDLPVFNSILNYRRAAPETNGPGQKADAGVAGTGDEVKITDRFLEDIQGRSFISFEERTNFPITLSIDDLGDGFRLVAQVREPIDPNRFCSYMETFLRQLIEGLETDPDRRLDELTILPNEERRLLLQDWQGAVVDYPDDRTLAQIFTARVTASPSATAVIDGGVAFTFEAINRKADAIAARLVAAGVRAPDRVVLHLDRSADLVAAIIACLKLGASFVPIATTLPGGRIAYLVEDSGARAVVTSSGHAADFVNPVRIDTLTDDEIEDAPALDPVSVDPGSAAYVMYTSGSTGQPKGVVGTHRATLNRFAWMWRAYPFEADEVMCQKTAISFGDSIWEVLGPLLAGVPQVVVPQDTVEEPRAFLTMLGRHGVTRLLIVPSLLRAILDSGLRLCEAAPSLRLLFTSGERLPADLARQFLDTAPDIRLINLYGASEVAADVTVHEVGPLDIDGGEVPIGKPIDNCRVYVLDHLRQLVPVGVSGELYVGGAALAVGYLGREDLTRARFVPDPFADQPDALMFATGDIVHHCDDGALIYEGRRDLQIKIRGMRVNLGEIETVLASQPGIAEAAVVVKGEGAAAWLLACVTPDGTAAAAPDAAALRRALTNTLPHYMVPARIAVIDAMPLNPSGKLDRTTLSNLADAALETPGDAVPERRTETERALLDQLQSLLHVDNLSVEDNFFEIGGNSLLALLLFDWIRLELGQDLPISTLFRHQTVRAIALYLDDLSATLPTCGDRDPRDDDWDTTTVIHPGPDETDAPPLFIVGGIGGNVNNLFELGRLLGRHRPVVGFQTRGVLGHRPHETIEDIAADDIHHMRQHQPKGPYSIGSYSGGAYTALEIARQLEAAGETVDHLLVIDSFTPQFAKRHMAAKRPRLSERLSLEFVLFQRNGLSSFVQRLRHQLSAQLVRGPLRPLVKQYGPDQYRYTTMLEAWRIAARGYRGGSVDASVTLFASDPTTSTVLSATRLDPSFGWSDLAAPDRFTRVEVGGSHLDMVKGPSAVLLAEEIEKALKRKPTGADLDYRTDEGKSRLAQ